MCACSLSRQEGGQVFQAELSVTELEVFGVVSHAVDIKKNVCQGHRRAIGELGVADLWAPSRI